MTRSALMLSLIILPAALISGCSDSCDELCGLQSRFVSGCLDEWAITWDDVTDADGEPYGSSSAYRNRCRDRKAAAVEENVTACAGIDDNAERKKCEDTFRLDIVDQCEGDKVNFFPSCADYLVNNVDPDLQLMETGDDSAAP